MNEPNLSRDAKSFLTDLSQRFLDDDHNAVLDCIFDEMLKLADEGLHLVLHNSVDALLNSALNHCGQTTRTKEVLAKYRITLHCQEGLDANNNPTMGRKYVVMIAGGLYGEVVFEPEMRDTSVLWKCSTKIYA